MSTTIETYPQHLGANLLTPPIDGMHGSITTDCQHIPGSKNFPFPLVGDLQHPQQPALTLLVSNNFFDDAMGYPASQQMSPVEESSGKDTKSMYQTRVPPPASGRSQEAIRPSTKNEGRAKPMTNNSETQPLLSATDDHSKAKRRGRKPKKQIREPELIFDPQEEDGELDEDGLPRDPRRRRILERNRIAATKCRLRKRDEASALASREKAMEDQNRYLSSCFNSLNAEIYQLKTQLLQHTDCGCVLIQKYIAHEARKSVDTMVGVSPSFAAANDTSSAPEYQTSAGPSSSAGAMYANPEGDELNAPWGNPNLFQQTPRGQTTPHGMMEDGTEEYQKAFMTPVQQDAVAMTPLTSPLATGYFDGCTSGISSEMGNQQMDGYFWDTTWASR